jgi:hypothetical protein
MEGLTASARSVFEQKSQKCLRNHHSIVLVPNPVQCILSLLIVEDALLVPHLDQPAHDALMELWMSLHGDQPALLIHALRQAARRATKLFHTIRVFEHDVLVHLMDCLRVSALIVMFGSINNLPESLAGILPCPLL